MTVAAMLDTTNVRRHLKQFDLRRLFIEELGWDNYQSEVEVTLDEGTCVLRAIAEKRGMVAFEACVVPDGGVPDYATRRGIERCVAKVAHEHLIIYTDAAKTTQVWQWVKREPGRPASCKEHTFHKDQAGDALIQKLQLIAFALEEEEDLTVVDVAGRVRKAFDVDRVTKRFYDDFKVHHAAFLKLIKGIAAEDEREWYASLMLNRLMFIYFIQRKGFLDGDQDYLRNRLRMMQERKKKDQFLTFYRHFLLRLFHEGLGQRKHPSELDELLGQVPYLNGGLFEVHKLEAENPDIQIPDSAFENLFDFFSEWHWHLDERPLREGKEINPDILGYIFEKYINQKQMGAYYTKEDITGYISRNTIIPFLFNAAEKACAVAFRPDGAVWRLLSDDPDRYIYEAVRHGVDVPLPEVIAAGIDDVSQRSGWNEPAGSDCALPTETWREHIARRQRCHEVRAKLAAGEVTDINDLITLNLDISQFAQDVIENCEGPELLRAFWKSIEKITVLDPTCGSGAFLFAALNILEPLYEACLVRMEAFVGDLDRSGEKHHPEKFSDFRKVLAHVADHPNRRYFILKSIIISNLFGVDIMEEAVEICKLRLFLKLAAQLDRFEDLEPLPDVDFNIRAGNTLVGCATQEEIPRSRLDFDDALPRIIENAEQADLAFQRFRHMQTEQEVDAGDLHQAKEKLRERLDALRDELDRHLAHDYEVDLTEQGALARWQRSHEPFHWFVEFYGIMHDGGFDVVIGNPPYVEWSGRRVEYDLRGYLTECCRNLYAYVMERSVQITRDGGRVGLIVPIGSVASQRTSRLQTLMKRASSDLHLSHYSAHGCPSTLFEGAFLRLSVWLAALRACPGDSLGSCRMMSSKYMKWYGEERMFLFQSLTYHAIRVDAREGVIPKIENQYAEGIATKIGAGTIRSAGGETRGQADYYYYNAPIHWVKAFDFLPRSWNTRDGVIHGSHYKALSFRNEEAALPTVAALNSSLSYLWFVLTTNCRDLAAATVRSFPFDALHCDEVVRKRLSQLARQLMDDYRDKATLRVRMQRTTGRMELQQIDPRLSKSIIDEIDRVLATHYGFTDEELDFIINYDFKYRMGAAEGESDDD